MRGAARPAGDRGECRGRRPAPWASVASSAPAPDGYTLSYGNWGTHVLNGVIQKVVLRRARPISSRSRCLPDNPYIVVTNAAVPAEQPSGALAWLKANPNTASQGTGGVGLRLARHRHLLPEPHRHAVPVRALSPGHRRADAGSARRADPDDVRPAVERGAACARAAASRPMRCWPRTGWRWRPRFRPWTRPVCRDFMCPPGTGSGRPRARRRTSIAKLNAAAVEALADPAVAQRLAGHGLCHHAARAADAGRRSPLTTRPRSRNGRRSSRRPASRRSRMSW